jgi:hypothetical protein
LAWRELVAVPGDDHPVPSLSRIREDVTVLFAFPVDSGYVLHRVLAEEVPQRFEQLNGGVLVDEDAHQAARP